MSNDPSTTLQTHLDWLRANDPSAPEALLEHTCQALQRLVRRMREDLSGLPDREGDEDAGQDAALRLCKALEQVRPATVRDFYRLAAAQIRRELLDLVCRYTGPQGPRADHEESITPAADTSAARADPGITTPDEGRLARWTDFHRQVDELPDPLREVFDLLYYQGLPHPEVAHLLAVPETTLRRRWLEARLVLQQKMRGESSG
jgi:RNA polymerase sigma factor (sigma-70 family)